MQVGSLTRSLGVEGSRPILVVDGLSMLSITPYALIKGLVPVSSIPCVKHRSHRTASTLYQPFPIAQFRVSVLLRHHFKPTMSAFKEVINKRPRQHPTTYIKQYAYMAEVCQKKRNHQGNRRILIDAQNSLPQSDYDSLMKAGEEAYKILHQSGLPIDHTGEQAWPAGAERLNAQVRAKHSATPEVSGGFKRFVEQARTAIANAK